MWFPSRCPAGQTCEIDINECVKSPCRNGATCQNTNGSYRCLCRVGFAGRNCDTDIDDCQPSKSQGHPGLCVLPRAGSASPCSESCVSVWVRACRALGMSQPHPHGAASI